MRGDQCSADYSMTIPYALADAIHRAINSSTQYVSDPDLYGRSEFWEIANGAGDCEDYALAKRQRLTQLGHGDQCRLATCWTETGEYHAVLIVTTDKGDYVLDNRHKHPMMRQDLGYKWDKIQEGASWHAVS